MSQTTPAVTAQKPAVRAAADSQKFSRSAVTNGAVLVPGADQRSARVRRMRDVMELHIGDLGGADRVSEAERSICRRIAMLTIELESLESKFIEQGEASDKQLDLYQRTSGNLRRLLEAIGIHRRPKNVTPTLEQYAASKRRE